MNRLTVHGQFYRIPDSWDTFTINGRVFRRRHAGAFVAVMSGREVVIPALFV